ncbi:MAG: hydrolase, partial [Cyclobacteriaceae bacterium]
MKGLLRSIVLIFLTPATLGYAIERENGEDNPILHIKRAHTPIVIDGLLNEGSWLEADSTGRFHQQFPYDSSLARTNTVVKATYDDNFIYFGAIIYTKDPSKYVVPSLRRDFFG